MGYYGKAEKATEEYKIKTAEEKIKLAILSYQASKESTTAYDELIKIEGLSFITPRDPNGGPPFTVVVDGYEFLIKEDLSIEYKGETEKTKESQPEITKVEYETGEVETLRVAITATTEDVEGLAKIDVYYKKQEGEEIAYEIIKSEEVSGTETTITVEIPINGDYVIQAIGKNEKIGTKEININNIKEGTVLVSVKQGEMNNQASTTLVIKGRTEGKTIEKMELYVKGEKVKTYEYKDLNKEREENYVVENLEFYKNVECYIKAWDSRGTETNSEIETIKNTKIIKTATDMKNLATQVNDYDNTFEGRTIQVINDITVEPNWIPIGYYDAIGLYTGKDFAGTFEGNNHTITINSMTKEQKYKCGGLFGMVIGGNVRNVTVNGKIDSNTVCIGGVVGAIKDGRIIHCINNSEITNTSEEQHGGIVGTVENSHIENCTNLGKVTADTNRIFPNGISVGGIVGYQVASTVKNTYNKGSIYGSKYVGGLVGVTQQVEEITGKNYFYNNYNASETVMGQEYVGNYAGVINYAEGAYNSAILNKTGVAGGENNTFTDYEEYTRIQMKTLNSELLILLQKGDGNGLWAQNTNINEGFPYLINNQP